MQKIDATDFARVPHGEKLILGILTNGQDVIAEAGDCLAVLTVETIHEVEFAFINARTPHSTAPIGTVWLSRPGLGKISNDFAYGLRQAWRRGRRTFRALREGIFKDKVVLIVYRDTDTVGLFGESRVLVLNEGEMQRYALLGTEDADAVLKEFALKAAAKRRSKRGLLDTDDDEEEED